MLLMLAKPKSYDLRRIKSIMMSSGKIPNPNRESVSILKGLISDNLIEELFHGLKNGSSTRRKLSQILHRIY